MSLERAREYDRVSEWLAANKIQRNSEKNYQGTSFGESHAKAEYRYGIEGRRVQFQKDSYRQPVLTRQPMNPKSYRRDQQDPETELCIKRLQELTVRHSSMSETHESMSIVAGSDDSGHNSHSHVV